MGNRFTIGDKIAIGVMVFAFIGILQVKDTAHGSAHAVREHTETSSQTLPPATLGPVTTITRNSHGAVIVRGVPTCSNPHVVKTDQVNNYMGPIGASEIKKAVCK